MEPVPRKGWQLCSCPGIVFAPQSLPQNSRAAPPHPPSAARVITDVYGAPALEMSQLPSCSPSAACRREGAGASSVLSIPMGAGGHRGGGSPSLLAPEGP